MNSLWDSSSATIDRSKYVDGDEARARSSRIDARSTSARTAARSGAGRVAARAGRVGRVGRAGRAGREDAFTAGFDAATCRALAATRCRGLNPASRPATAACAAFNSRPLTSRTSSVPVLDLKCFTVNLRSF